MRELRFRLVKHISDAMQSCPDSLIIRSNFRAYEPNTEEDLTRIMRCIDREVARYKKLEAVGE